MPEPVCSECGGPGVVANGICRKCYDKQRAIVTLNIAKDIKGKVLDFAKDKKWSMPYTCNYLMKCGLKWVQEAETMREKYKP